MPILALTNDAQTMRICQGYYKNTIARTVSSLNDHEKTVNEAFDLVKSMGICKEGEHIVLVNGVEKTTGGTDTMRIITCK